MAAAGCEVLPNVVEFPTLQTHIPLSVFGAADVSHPSWDDEVSLFRRHVGEMPALEASGERAARVGLPKRRPPRIEVRAPPAAFEPEPSEAVERGSRIEFARPGLQRRELRRLRRGYYAVQDQLDLHGLFAAEAEQAVLDFIGGARRRGLRCIRVVHGKGRSSTGGRPVLKAGVDRWLRLCEGVLAFCPAPDNAGGAGAVHVLLRS